LTTIEVVPYELYLMVELVIVTRGMDVVKTIQASPTGSQGPYGTESLMPPIRIVKAYRKER